MSAQQRISGGQLAVFNVAVGHCEVLNIYTQWCGHGRYWNRSQVLPGIYQHRRQAVINTCSMHLENE
jgi:hypothetical protein